jgi:hypothetical protein
VREQVNHTRSAEAMTELLHAYLGELAAGGGAFGHELPELAKRNEASPLSQSEASPLSPTHAAG